MERNNFDIPDLKACGALLEPLEEFVVDSTLNVNSRPCATCLTVVEAEYKQFIRQTSGYLKVAGDERTRYLERRIEQSLPSRHRQR